jgi:hypothetical protein
MPLARFAFLSAALFPAHADSSTRALSALLSELQETGKLHLGV